MFSSSVATVSFLLRLRLQQPRCCSLVLPLQSKVEKSWRPVNPWPPVTLGTHSAQSPSGLGSTFIE